MASQLLKGKKGIIFGALDERSIAWKTALVAHAEGAQLVLTNAPIALRMGKINELSKLCGDAPVIPADATSMADLESLLNKSMETFGGKIDFMLHSIGMSPNVRKSIEYTDAPYITVGHET
jgi:enoyl-[acyl-carrier protein] reductase I